MSLEALDRCPSVSLDVLERCPSVSLDVLDRCPAADGVMDRCPSVSLDDLDRCPSVSLDVLDRCPAADGGRSSIDILMLGLSVQERSLSSMEAARRRVAGVRLSSASCCFARRVRTASRAV